MECTLKAACCRHATCCVVSQHASEIQCTLAFIEGDKESAAYTSRYHSLYLPTCYMPQGQIVLQCSAKLTRYHTKTGAYKLCHSHGVRQPFGTAPPRTLHSKWLSFTSINPPFTLTPKPSHLTKSLHCRSSSTQSNARTSRNSKAQQHRDKRLQHSSLLQADAIHISTTLPAHPPKTSATPRVVYTISHLPNTRWTVETLLIQHCHGYYGHPMHGTQQPCRPQSALPADVVAA
jgi:hypothetical protein